MTAATWGDIHVYDEVRGADQRVWTVVGRSFEREWIGDGREAQFTLEHESSGRIVTAWRMLADPAPLVARADHSAEASAVQAFIDSGIGFKILEERTVTTAELQQPAAAPIKRDRWNRYLLPHPETGKEQAWTRATTIARVLADEYNLGQWAERMVAKGMALRPDLVAGAAAADLEADKSTLQSIAQQAKDHAGGKSGANLGTALHTFTERLDRGETLKSLSAPQPLGKDLRAYQKELKAAGLRIVPEFIERVVICPELGVAGTLDRLAELAGGALRVLDLKTAKSVEYSWLEIAIQLAIYVHATHAWNAAAQAWEPMPTGVLDQNVGLVLHLPVGKASPAIWQVNLAEGWRLAQIAVDVKAARGAAKKLAIELSVETPDTVLKHITAAADQQALAALWETYHPRGLWTADVQRYAEARLRQIDNGGVTVSATATETSN